MVMSDGPPVAETDIQDYADFFRDLLHDQPRTDLKQEIEGICYLRLSRTYRQDYSGVCLVTSGVGPATDHSHGRVSWISDHLVQLSARVDIRNIRLLHCPISRMAEFEGYAPWRRGAWNTRVSRYSGA